MVRGSELGAVRMGLLTWQNLCRGQACSWVSQSHGSGGLGLQPRALPRLLVSHKSLVHPKVALTKNKAPSQGTLLSQGDQL